MHWIIMPVADNLSLTSYESFTLLVISLTWFLKDKLQIKSINNFDLLHKLYQVKVVKVPVSRIILTSEGVVHGHANLYVHLGGALKLNQTVKNSTRFG